jgi:hypothetical protein
MAHAAGYARCNFNAVANAYWASDGTFYSPKYSTKVHHCNSTECYFKGY